MDFSSNRAAGLFSAFWRYQDSDAYSNSDSSGKANHVAYGMVLLPAEAAPSSFGLLNQIEAQPKERLKKSIHNTSSFEN